MKNKFIRLISSLLVLSFLVAMFSVFSFAESTGTEEEQQPPVNLENLVLFVNRDFSDGWEADNGFNNAFKPNGNKIAVDYEIDITGKYNYFARFEALASGEAKAEINFGALSVTPPLVQNTLGTILEFSLKADDVAKLGNILYMTTSVHKNTVRLLDINKEGRLIAFPEYQDADPKRNKSFDLGELGNQWINIAFMFDWEADSLAGTLKVGYGYQNGYEKDYKFDIPYQMAGDLGMSALDFVIAAGAARTAGSAAESLGMSYCLDNFKLYHGTKYLYDFADDDYGKYVDTGAAKTVTILESATEKTKDKILEETLAMKLGVDYALVKNSRYALTNNSDSASYSNSYGAPVKVDGKILVPLELIIDYIGYPKHLHKDNMSYDITTGSSTTYITVGRDTATVNGKKVNLSTKPGYIENSEGESYLVAALEDIPVMFPGWLTFYDDMGLIIIYEDSTPNNSEDNEPILNREENLSTMLGMMKKFVFDTVTDTDRESGYIMNGEKVYEDAKQNTEDFAHPYLVANSDDFEKLAAKYALTEGSEGYDKALKSYLQIILDKAEEIYTIYAEKDSSNNYVDLKQGSIPKQPGTTDGYDQNGKMTALVEYASLLPTLAFAFQINGNENYAKLAYNISASLAVLSHWGPGYVNDFAKISSNFAISYDWLYNEYKALGLDTDVLAEAIFELGVHDGYVSSSGMGCEHGRLLGDLSLYNTSKDSVNAIGSSAMIISALSILDYVKSENAPKNANKETLYLIGNNIQSLITYGLDIYAPDGSYIESPVHWEEATSAFFRMSMALDSAAGTNYGLLDSWGMNSTCYYAIHIENPDGFIWNYHESTEYTKLNTDMLFYAGMSYGDETLIAVRQQQLAAGRSVSVYDLIFYPYDGVSKAPELSLDYHMEAIEGFVSRSDWTNSAIYTGLMGGSNAATNGQLDSGNFIYQNKGVAWIVDLGNDNPNITGISDPATRYKFYKNSAEGQNVLIKTGDSKKIPYGQRTDAGGTIISTIENEYGSAVLLDNTDVYRNFVTSKGGSEVSYARRGLLFTNDRSTVVLQDQFAFIYNGAVTWIVHTKANPSLDDTGRVAYLTSTGSDGRTYTVRASIVSKNPNFQFQIESADKSLLGTNSLTTVRNEDNRGNYSRLIISVTDVTLFEIAVVFELVDNTKDKTPVAYNWVDMFDWVPQESTDVSVGESANLRTEPLKDEIVDYAETASNYLKRNAVYTKTLNDLYRTLTNAGYLLKLYPESTLTESTHVVAYGDYVDCVEKYENFMEYVNGIADTANDLAFALTGMQTESDADAEE